MKIKKALKMLNGLAHENRVNIFRLLIKEGPEGLSAGSIAEILQITPATLSFHLAQMQDADLVTSTRHGRTIMYAAKYKAAKRLVKFLTEGSYKKRQKELAQQAIFGEGEAGEEGSTTPK